MNRTRRTITALTSAAALTLPVAAVSTTVAHADDYYPCAKYVVALSDYTGLLGIADYSGTLFTAGNPAVPAGSYTVALAEGTATVVGPSTELPAPFTGTGDKPISVAWNANGGFDLHAVNWRLTATGCASDRHTVLQATLEAYSAGHTNTYGVVTRTF
ncbi:hypothetical protein HUT16_14905 [Kitasatospora sp. NA04385]|uniref:hypothetical protein n=1 Tax=Kitasatospora sp. NA04385 TaxID=2742135 RepID=UPI001591BC51|nr:hypothetical protein [Kitasatospora sp. NA04385]QKW20183.1 hypothetical protein HUT16_14905 [Kitasatospora sp. NA04385]